MLTRRRVLTTGLASVVASPLVATSPKVVIDDYYSVARRVSEQVRFSPRHHPPARKVQNQSVYFVYDDLLSYEGVEFGERFVGQSTRVRYLRGVAHDTLSGNPTTPLTVVPGKPNQNLALHRPGKRSIHDLYGIGTYRFPWRSAFAEGAISFLFDEPQKAFGFRYHSGSDSEYLPGRKDIVCYDVQGSQIAHFIVPTKIRGSFAASVADGSRRIFGVSVTNLDPGGIGLREVVFDLNALATS